MLQVTAFMQLHGTAAAAGCTSKASTAKRQRRMQAGNTPCLVKHAKRATVYACMDNTHMYLTLLTHMYLYTHAVCSHKQPGGLCITAQLCCVLRQSRCSCLA
jgi:hypothetical protein